MRFKRDATVRSAAGEDLGRVERVVLDPAGGQVTHLVVKTAGLLGTERVLPVQWVEGADEAGVVLRSEFASLDDLPSFEETHYVQANEGEAAPVGKDQLAPLFFWYPPVIGFQPPGTAGAVETGFPGLGYLSETEQNIPAHTIALKEGAVVKTHDGEEVGRIEEVITGSGGEATHLVIGGGLLQKKRRLVPAHWVRQMAEDEVVLAVDANLVKRLKEHAGA